MKVKITIFLLFLVSFLAPSCSVRLSTEEALDLSNGGAISLKLNAAELPSATRAISIPEISNSLIEITSSRANAEGGYDKPYSGFYTSMPSSVAVPDGLYTVSATLGDSEPFTLVSPTFYAQKEVEIFVAHSLAVALELKMLSYAVEVDLTDKFLETFEYFSVEVQIEGESYNFAQNTSEIAYLAPGSSQLIFSGVTKTGQEIAQNLGTLTSLGCEHHILTLDIRPNGFAFEILVDKEVVNYDISADVDSELYPDMPKASYGALSFYESEIIVDEISDNSRITLRSLIRVKAATIQLSDEKFATLGIDNTRIYDLSKQADVYALIGLGFIFDLGGVIGVSNPKVYLGSFSEKLLSYGGTATTYNIEVNVTDHLDESATTIVPIIVNAPVFSMSELNPGNVWTKEFTFDPIASNSNIVQGDYDLMVSRGQFSYQISSDEANWSDIATNVTTCSGLTQSESGSPYYLRAKYRDIYSATLPVMTAPARQIPNSNFSANHSTENRGQPCYWFFANGAVAAEQWWSTINAKTTSEGQFRTQYCAYSGARPTDNAGIELVTCGWGYGNNATLWPRIENVSAGRVFLGGYGDNKVHHGREFNSRPTGVSFNYKYSPYNNKGDKYVVEMWLENRDDQGAITQLAHSKISEGNAVSSWTNKTLNLTFSNRELPITHICLMFQSGINELEGQGNQRGKGWVKPPEFTKNDPSRGSVFNVNDVTLIYGK